MERMYYIIESPTLGALQSVEHEPDGKVRPRYSVTGPRSDAYHFRTFTRAEDMRDMLVNSYARGSKNIKIRRSSDWKAYCDDCNMFADAWHEHSPECRVYKETMAKHGYNPDPKRRRR